MKVLHSANMGAVHAYMNANTRTRIPEQGKVGEGLVEKKPGSQVHVI